MFLDLNAWPPPLPPAPEPRPPRMSRRDEAQLMWLLGAALFALFLAPIGGVSVVEIYRVFFSH